MPYIIRVECRMFQNDTTIAPKFFLRNKPIFLPDKNGPESFMSNIIRDDLHIDTLVRDVLFIKTIEKAIGRKLDELDLECIQYGEPIFVQNKNGRWASYVVPTYHMPHDLMQKDIDLYAVYAQAATMSKDERNPNIWESQIYNVITNAKMKIANSIKATYE